MIRRLTAAFTLIAALLVPSAAHAASHMEFALQDDAVFVNEQSMSRDAALEHAQQLGAKRIRVNILWARALTSGPDSKTMPAAGPQYDFTKLDDLQKAAASHNIKLQLTLTGPAPAWATKDHKIGPPPPTPALSAGFGPPAAAHFAGRVDRYSIWNEPNLSAWLAPSSQA